MPLLEVTVRGADSVDAALTVTTPRSPSRASWSAPPSIRSPLPNRGRRVVELAVEHVVAGVADDPVRAGRGVGHDVRHRDIAVGRRRAGARHAGRPGDPAVVAEQHVVAGATLDQVHAVEHLGRGRVEAADRLGQPAVGRGSPDVARRATDEVVVAGAPEQVVGADVALDVVVVAAAGDHVVPALGEDPVAVRTGGGRDVAAVERVVAVRRAGCREGRRGDVPERDVVGAVGPSHGCGVVAGEQVGPDLAVGSAVTAGSCR